jgi:NADH dehydrogenase
MHNEATSTAPARLDLDIVILGGGFAGVYCGRELGRQLRGKKECRQVAIVSNQNYLVFQPMLAEVAGGSLSPRHVVNPIRLLCRGIRVLKGEIRRVDLEKKEVFVHTGAFSAGVIVTYQDLVFALGAEIDLSRVPGMPEHALLMQNVGDAMLLRATIISRIEEANIETRPEVRKRLLTFVVVGGGYSGVETAGEILDLLRGVAKYYISLDPKEFRVILIHSRERILGTLSSNLGQYAERKLRQRGMEFHLNDRVKAVTATKVYLQSGTEIDTATVVSTVGTTPHSVIRSVCDDQGLGHDRFWIKTDSSMRVPGRDGLWAAGDCASVPLHKGNGERCPQTAQFALRQGAALAGNLLRARKGRQPKPFTFQGMGELASIGHRTAVANVMGITMSGFIAWFMWRTVYLSKLPGLDRKLRVMVEWTMDLFFPRDINLLSPRASRVCNDVHLEPGDILFTKGEPAFSLYVVKEGQIELRDETDTVVRTVQPGEFFGERALVHGTGYLYKAIAPVKTELLSASGDAILPVLQTSTRLRAVLAHTTSQGSAEAELRAVEEKLDRSLLDKPVSAVMRKDVATLSLGQTVQSALAFFKERRHSMYPITDAEGVLLGTVSRTDFFDFLKKHEVHDDSVIDAVNRRSLPTCLISSTVEQALERMIRSGNFKCLVIDDAEKLHGIITVMDLIGETD